MTRIGALLLTVLAAWASIAGARDLRPFTAIYEVHHSGARVGETTLSLSRSPDSAHWEFHSRTQPRGLAALIRRRDVVETSLFDVEGERLVPRSYFFDEGAGDGKRDSRIEFDWSAAKAQGRYGKEDKEIALSDGMLDRLLVQLAIMGDIAAGDLPQAYTIVDRNATKTYDFTLVGEEMLPTPAGQFDTVKVRRQRPGSSRATLIWAAVELDYLPVKMVQLKDDRPNTVLTLTDVQGFTTNEADKAHP